MDAKTYDKLAIEAVRKAAPSVVSIVVSKYIPRMHDINPVELFHPFQMGDVEDGAGQKVKIGGGSGFIVHPDGLVLTNKHVVIDKDAEYTVVMNDLSEHPAKVLSRDPVNDIAILKIDKKDLPHLVMSHDDIELGQTVIAIGNALGMFSNSVSKGIISGLARSISASLGGTPESAMTENLRGVIQTDVAINQGNSGGPLINLDAEVVGVNTAVIFGAQNIGFAIPIDWAKSDLKDIIEHGRIIKPYLGLMYVMLTPEISKRYGLAADHGAMVIRDRRPDAQAVLAGSPAHKAGLKEHDIITTLDGSPIPKDKDLMDLLQKHQVGDTVKLGFLRGGKEHDCEVTLEERK